MNGKQKNPEPSKPWLLLADDPKPSFLNVDLHIESRKDLTPLAAALNRSILWQDHVDPGHWLHGCLATGRDTLSEIVLRLATLVKRLRGHAKAAWNDAKVKELDIGIQAGTDNRPGEWIVGTDAVQSAARVGAQIRITVYSPQNTPAPRRKSKKPGRARKAATEQR